MRDRHADAQLGSSRHSQAVGDHIVTPRTSFEPPLAGTRAAFLAHHHKSIEALFRDKTNHRPDAGSDGSRTPHA